jgi:hypothetical protein
MGAPDSGMQAAEQPTAETLLTAFRTIKAAERQKHAVVLDYWLSIRGDKEFPPLHDLDPLEISDAGPCSILLELIGGGQDAEIRHLGEALKADVTVDRIIDSPNPSILSCIAKKLPIVAISRDFLAFEDNFRSGDGFTRCWVTLLPLSSCGSWVDYVYAFVSVETTGGRAAKIIEVAEVDEAPPTEEAVAKVAEVAADVPTEEPEAAADVVSFVTEEPEEAPEETAGPVEAVDTSYDPEPIEAVKPVEAVHEPKPQPEPEPELEPELSADAPATSSGPGFSKMLEGIAQLTGFYGQGVKVEDPVVHVEVPAPEPTTDEPAAIEPFVDEPEAVEPAAEIEEPAPAADPEELVPAAKPVAIEQPVDEPPEEIAPEVAPEVEPEPAMEGILQSKLSEVRAKADEARQAALRATAALHEGVSAAYDFALDAESSPEEYLRLVEAQGLKIQLRAPMAPVARLAFDGLVDAATLTDAEKLLAWALKVELPRGALLERIERAGGVSELLRELARAS